MKGLIFTYAMTYGGSLLALFNPFLGLLIYVCFAILRPQSMWSFSVPEGNYSRIVAAALLVGWMLQGFGSWSIGRAGLIGRLLLAFWAWGALSSAFAADQATAWPFVEEMAKTVLPFLVGITIIDSTRQLIQLAWVIALSHGYVAWEMNLSYYEGYNRVVEEGFGGMDNNCVAIAMVTATGLVLFLGLYEKRLWLKCLALAGAMLMIHTVLFSFSRGGMLALIVMGLVAFLLIPKRPIHFLIFAAVVLASVRLAGPEVRKRFLTSFAEKGQRDASAEGRVDLWANCCDVIAKNPVVGIGPRHWPRIAPAYGWPLGKEAHTLWLQLGAELGIPGLFLLAMFYGTCVVRLWPLAMGYGTVPDPGLRNLARAVIASISGFVVASQFVSMIGLEAPYYVVLIGAGTLKLAGMPAAIPASSDQTDSLLAAPALA